MYARSFLKETRDLFPGITKKWNGKATLSTPFLDPNLLCSYSYWKSAVHLLQRLRRSGAEGDPLRRRALLAELPGFMEAEQPKEPEPRSGLPRTDRQVEVNEPGRQRVCAPAPCQDEISKL